jgi:cell division protein FtsB
LKEELQEASDENDRLRAEQQALQAEIDRIKQASLS